jgi:hypothetical protein
MGTYVIPGATSAEEAAAYSPWPGRIWREVPGGIEVSDPNLSDADLAAAYAGFTPSGADPLTYQWPLSPAVRTEAARIKQSAEYTDAQLDAAFAAGAQRELAYTLRSVCRALVWLVDNRLGD